MKRALSEIDMSKLMQSGHPVAWLAKLKWEITQAAECTDLNPAVRVWKSMNCAITAWHMHDWVWNFADENMKNKLAHHLNLEKITRLGDFSIGIQKASPAISLCRQIGTAVKHVSLTYNRPEVRTQVVKMDEDSRVPYTINIFEGDQAYSDISVYLSALEAWSRIYVHLQLPEYEEVASMYPKWNS